MCLLEANLSCNFFRASFDVGAYGAFVEEVLEFLEASPTVSEGADSPAKPAGGARWKEK